MRLKLPSEFLPNDVSEVGCALSGWTTSGERVATIHQLCQAKSSFCAGSFPGETADRRVVVRWV